MSKKTDAAVSELSDRYIELIRPLVEQAVANGMIWGSLYMPVADTVRKDIIKKMESSELFMAFNTDAGSLYNLAQKEWPSEMISLQNLRGGRGQLFIPEFNELSAYYGFQAGVGFAQRVLTDFFKRIVEEDVAR